MCQEGILKCDGEPALRSVQEEVKRRRETLSNLANSEVRAAKPTEPRKAGCRLWVGKCG